MKLNPKNKIFLAPMEEVNDVVFRLLCKKAGASLTWTGMIHPQTQQKIHLDDKPVLQLFCTTTKGIKDFVKTHDKEVSAWDFNLGCPAKTAQKHGFGSYLTDLEIIEKIISEIRKHTKKPFFVKVRKSKNSFKILKIAEKYCDAICIHPRTRSQGYGGEPDLNYALEFKNKAKIPVIYSGNVTESNYKELLKKFDYLIIGRKAIGNPNIFSITSNGEKTNFNFNDYMKLAKKYSFPFRQIKFQAMQFTKGMKNATEKREKLVSAKSVKEILEIMK